MIVKNSLIYIEAVTSYIQRVLGVEVHPKIWEGEHMLPLLLKEKYVFFLIRISGMDCLLFIDHKEDRNTPAGIAAHCSMLKEYWTGGLIYSRKTLSSTDRTRLIQSRVPFIIPGKQLYIPFLAMELKESFPPERKRSDTLSPSAQLLILGKLYKKEWITESPSHMAGHIGFTNMTIGRAFEELELHGISSVTKSGKNKSLEFHTEGRELWERIQPLLRSPVTSTETDLLEAQGDVVLSGLSALSCYSMLAEPYTRTFAVSNRIHSHGIHTKVASLPSDTEITLQKWSYEPRVLSINGVGDPLSIYLQWRASGDERIEEALEELIKGIRW